MGKVITVNHGICRHTFSNESTPNMIVGFSWRDFLDRIPIFWGQKINPKTTTGSSNLRTQWVLQICNYAMHMYQGTWSSLSGAYFRFPFLWKESSVNCPGYVCASSRSSSSCGPTAIPDNAVQNVVLSSLFNSNETLIANAKPQELVDVVEPAEPKTTITY